MDPRNISIRDFTYDLPPDRIATHPLAERDLSRLLVYKDGQITDSSYQNLAEFIPSHGLVVLNDTRVVEARLIFQKPTGGKIEIFCLEPGPGYPDITTAMQQSGEVTWNCLIGGASKWKPGQKLVMELGEGPTAIRLEAQYLQKQADSFLIRLAWTPATMSFAELLHHAGKVPLPPYLHREVEEEDAERYQTIYARQEGSVAAPTAGLHFTPRLFDSLAAKHISLGQITLHVGAGTFKPVKAGTMQEHEMHAEFIDVSAATIRQLRGALTENIIAVGTTSLRTLESLYWIGVQLQRGKQALSADDELDQWYPYDHDTDLPAEQALDQILQWLEKNNKKRLITKTRLLIVPGYRFRIVNILVTNFHQPESTLLLLVAAFTNNNWRLIYEHALKNEYRFLSYGDGCVLFRR